MLVGVSRQLGVTRGEVGQLQLSGLSLLSATAGRLPVEPRNKPSCLGSGAPRTRGAGAAVAYSQSLEIMPRTCAGSSSKI